MADRIADRTPKTVICFGNLYFVFDGEGEMASPRSPTASTQESRHCHEGPLWASYYLYPRSDQLLWGLDFIINEESEMVRVPPAQPSSPKNPEAVVEALGGLSLAPHGATYGERIILTL